MPQLYLSLFALVFCAVAGLATFPAYANSISGIQKMIRAEQYSLALVKADAYLATKPEDPQGLFLKGVILTAINKPADAIGVFTRLTEKFPDLPEPYNNLAVIYAQQKQYDKARMALETATRAQPSYSVAYENLGDVYARLATLAYDKAMALDSSSSAAQGKLASVKDQLSTFVRPKTKPVDVAEPAPARESTSSSVSLPVEGGSASKDAQPAEVGASAAEVSVGTEPGPGESPEAEVKRSVLEWADAWSSKDVKRYLAHYAFNFETPNGISRDAWATGRQQRLDIPGEIHVGLADVKISVSGDSATVRFRQDYKSNKLNTSVGKTLVLIKFRGKWLIQQERVG